MKAFPVEILTIIFEFVYLAASDASDDTPDRRAFPGSVYRPHGAGGGKYAGGPQRSITPAREVVNLDFPLHTFAGVCRQWRDIIHTLPEFLSRIAIFVDDPPTPLASIQEQIKATRGFPLDILVTRRDFDEESDPEIEHDYFKIMTDEKARVKEVVKLLPTLIPTSRSIVFDLQYSTSLPYISRDFHGPAKLLRVLKLACVQEGLDDTEHLPFLGVVSRKTSGDEFEVPLLSVLVLDGNTLVDALLLDSWKRQMKIMSMDTLSTSHLNLLKYENFTFTIHDLVHGLANFGSLRNLTLFDIKMESGCGDDDGGSSFLVDNLIMEDMDELCAEEFNVASDSGSTWCFAHFINTPITHASIPLVHHLRLQNIPNMGFEFNRSLTRFFGNRLDFLNCPELDDDHLEHIANSCLQVRRIYIENCPGITVQGLQVMITARGDLVDDSDDLIFEKLTIGYRDETESLLGCNSEADEKIQQGYDNNYQRKVACPIHRLHVTGHPAKLTRTERKWFERNVETFTWT